MKAQKNRRKLFAAALTVVCCLGLLWLYSTAKRVEEETMSVRVERVFSEDRLAPPEESACIGGVLYRRSNSIGSAGYLVDWFDDNGDRIPCSQPDEELRSVATSTVCLMGYEYVAGYGPKSRTIRPVYVDLRPKPCAKSMAGEVGADRLR